MSLTETDSDNELVTHIFDKPSHSPHRVRKKVYCFATKDKIFCALHKPIGYAKVYHFIVLLLIFSSVIALNIFDEGLAKKEFAFETNFMYFKVFTDTSATIILCIELVLRNWSCDVNNDYRHLRGRALYWKHYLYSRALDVIGIIGFVCYIVNHIYFQHKELDSNLRILHLTQILQLYRLLNRFLRVIIDTILYQKNQLVIVLILMFFAGIFTAFCVYLIEREVEETKIHSILDAFWMTFVTFTTIGYGDIYPKSKLGKILVMACGSIGFIFFALPIGILGSGLALKIEEDERKRETHRIPAARLIQSVWRSYASNKRYESGANWKQYQLRDGKEMTAEDRACVRFIRTVIYLKQRHRFKVLGLVNDEFFRERSVRELSRRLRLTENDFKYIENNVNKTLEKRTKTNDIFKKLKKKLTEIKDKKQIVT